jgi:hypothetical protein
MGVLTEADVRAAQAAVDALAPIVERWREYPLDDKDRLELRGMLAGQFADVRAAGYLEGVQRGRREAAHVVLDALRGEGLAP